jgi:hypothetical protein|tara:strand:- start:7784 stop:8734 length:951 start_codon:yes stop_codon:yes gene_type:complete
MAEQEMTTKGRKVYQDEETGENYSERSITFETENGWLTIPTVDAEGNQYTQAELEEFVSENGPIDPLTGEELPLFETVEDAEAYAQDRSDTLMPEDEQPMQNMMGLYHGGMACGDAGNVGYDSVSGNPIPAGSNAMSVRDDIPAVLSEGEYVVPADVVRYHGLKTFMGLRDEAKMGLMMMQAEGQIKSLEDEEEQDTVECPDCSGTGELDGAECEHCEGYGYHYADEIEYEESDSESSEDTEVSDEESIAEEGEGQFQEEYETPEGNTVNTAVNEVVEEFMTPYDVDLKDEEDLYPTKQGQFAYKPSVKFAVMKMK